MRPCAVFEKHSDTMETPGTELVTPRFPGGQIGQSISLLLAEDDPVNQLVTSSILAKYGYHVDVAGNGREALKLLESNDYAAVLMDCMMPEVNGYEATAVIRDLTSPVTNHSIPIIAMTARVFKEDRDNCIAAGMDDYLPKPIVLAEMLAKLEKWTGCTSDNRAEAEDAVAADVFENKVFDLDELVGRTAGDKDLISGMANLFVEGAPKYIETICNALASHDIPALIKSAHKLKGSAANIALSPLSALAFKIESIAESGDLERAQQLLPELEARLDQAVTAINGLLMSLDRVEMCEPESSSS